VIFVDRLLELSVAESIQGDHQNALLARRPQRASKLANLIPHEERRHPLRRPRQDGGKEHRDHQEREQPEEDLQSRAKNPHVTDVDPSSPATVFSPSRRCNLRCVARRR
jgi:hypothetical protein